MGAFRSQCRGEPGVRGLAFAFRIMRSARAWRVSIWEAPRALAPIDTRGAQIALDNLMRRMPRRR